MLLYTFSSDSEWMIKSIITTFEIAGDLVQEETGDFVFLILSKNTENPEKGDELRKCAVVEALKVLDKDLKDLNNISLSLLTWTVRVLGEFMDYSDAQSGKVIDTFRELLNKEHVTRGLQSSIITALLKYVSKTKDCSEKIMEAVARCRESSSSDIKQKSREFVILVDDLVLLNKLLEPSYTEEITIDETLSFLDEFVETALKDGAKPYNPIPIVRSKETSESEKKPIEIRYKAYDKPTLPYYRNQTSISNSTLSEPKYGDSGLATSPIDDGILSSWSGNPPVTPGQLAWMSVSQDTLTPGDYGDYEEFDGRQSLMASVARVVTSPSSLKWCRTGYKPIQQQSSRIVSTSPTLSAISSEDPVNSSTSNVHPFLRTSVKAAPITSITAKNVVTHEKDRLASALFSGVGENKGMNSSIYGHSEDVSSSGSLPKYHPRKSMGVSQNHAKTESTFLETYNNRGSLLMNKNILRHLSPFQMTINDYEKFWTNLSNERQEEVVGELVINNMEIIKQRLEDGINELNVGIGSRRGSWKVIEVIDREAIAASQYNHPSQISSSTLSLSGNIVLLHFKIQPLHCLFTVRSNIGGIIDDVTEEMKSYFMWQE
ncbi:16950_t:CDS:10 [Funneliformis geosporum]|nr:16950_t:CDS:10 [Funneliformis geosporum]